MLGIAIETLPNLTDMLWTRQAEIQLKKFRKVWAKTRSAVRLTSALTFR